MKRKLCLLFLFILPLSFLLNLYPIRAEENSCTNTSSLNLDQVERCLADLKKAYEMSRAATKPLESQLVKMKEQIADIKNRVAVIEQDIDNKKKSIDEGYINLAKQETILATTIRDYYIKSYYNSPFLVFLSASSASDITSLLAYQKAAANQDKIILTNIALSLKDLEIKKENLENEQKQLAQVKATLDEQSDKLDKVVQGAKAYQANLSSQIAQLSTLQQQFIAQKLGSLNLPTSLGAGPLFCTDDRKLDPGFSPAFAFFTYGIPHRIGMNQYGALGRAKAGQSYQDILRAYFDGINFEKRDPNTRIKVQGFGEMNLDDYLLGIYEMPGDWPLDALKAQVVAARSYALAYTNNGANEICTTQACQVYKGGSKGGDWEKAVRETAGEVMTNNGQVITAWYSSTDGGYTFRSDDVGWAGRPWTKRLRDTSGDVSSFSDLNSNAYDKDSPCFYAAQGYRSEYSKSAWLKASEVADIANIILLARKDSSTQEHLYQSDKPNPKGTETWDAEKVKQELRSRSMTPFNNVTDVSIEWDKGIGKTTSIQIGEGGLSERFDGTEFKNFFNLRAPANINIVGPLYNIERR